MDYLVRGIKPDEWPLLEDFLYEAIWASASWATEIRSPESSRLWLNQNPY